MATGLAVHFITGCWNWLSIVGAASWGTFGWACFGGVCFSGTCWGMFQWGLQGSVWPLGGVTGSLAALGGGLH